MLDGENPPAPPKQTAIPVHSAPARVPRGAAGEGNLPRDEGVTSALDVVVGEVYDRRYNQTDRLGDETDNRPMLADIARRRPCVARFAPSNCAFTNLL